MSDPFRSFGDYEFSHFVGTCAEVGATDEVHRLFAHEDDQGRNAWFAARDARNELAGYLEDLRIASELAERAATTRQAPTRARAAGLQCRYALLLALIRDTAANLHSGLSGTLVHAQIWTREQALAWADLHRDRHVALATVVDALREPGSRQDEFGLLALSTGAAIGSSDNKTLAVAALAEQLPPHQRGRALEVIAREPNEGSRLGGLERIVDHLPRTLLERATEVANGFHQNGLRARALAAVAHALEEPARGEAYAAALESARSMLEDAKLASAAQILKPLAKTLPLERLVYLLQLASNAELAVSEWETVCAAVLERYTEQRPDWALEQARGLKRGLGRDDVLAAVAVVFARDGRPTDALDVWEEIWWEPTAAGVVGSLAERLPPEWLAELAKRVTRLAPHHCTDALSGIARAPSAPADALLAVADGLPDDDTRRNARLAIVPALSSEAIDDILAASPSLDGMDHVAIHLTLAQTERVLDAVRGSRLWGLERDALAALLGRLAMLGRPDEALARAAELDHIREHDRAEIVGQLAPYLPASLLLPARRLVRPDAIPVPRLRARAILAANLPTSACESLVREAGELPDALDRVRVLTAIAEGLPAGRGHSAAAALLRAIKDSSDHPSLDRREVLADGWRRLGEGPPEGAPATALALIEEDDRIAALLALSGTCQEAAAFLIGELVARPHLASVVVAARPSQVVGHRLADALRDLSDDSAVAGALAVLAELLPRQALPTLIGHVAAWEDVGGRLLALDALLSHAAPSLRRRAAQRELERREGWSDSPWLHILGTCVVSRGDRRAGRALQPDATQLVHALPSPVVRATGAAMLAETLHAPIAPAILEEALKLLEDGDIGAVDVLAPFLDRPGIARVRASLAECAGNVRDHELVVDLARRALALGDQQLALDCLSVRDYLYRRDDAVAAIADELPSELLGPAADVAGGDRDALVALGGRAAALGDGPMAVGLAARALSAYDCGYVLAAIAPLVPASSVPEVLARARLTGSAAARALAALVPRVPRAERRELLAAALEAAAELRLAMNEERVRSFHMLAPELERLPAAELTRLWGEALRRSAPHGREEVLCDIRGFAPALLRRLGRDAADALEHAIHLGARDTWP